MKNEEFACTDKNAVECSGEPKKAKESMSGIKVVGECVVLSKSHVPEKHHWWPKAEAGSMLWCCPQSLASEMVHSAGLDNRTTR